MQIGVTLLFAKGVNFCAVEMVSWELKLRLTFCGFGALLWTSNNELSLT